MRQILTTDDLEGLSYAYKDAKRITLWEKSPKLIIVM